MRKNGLFSLIYHALFIAFILAPLVVVVLVSFTSKGYISLPTTASRCGGSVPSAAPRKL